jgi:hypothetical protein
MTRSARIAVACVLGLLAGVSSLNASTTCTFADPSPDGTQPLFELSGITFVGSWTQPGLLFETPGLPLPNYPDATFTMTPLIATPIIPGLWTLTGGEIDFADNGGHTVFIINFDAATLNADTGFGANDLSLQNVRFTAPDLGWTFSNERFAFSFANAEITPNGMSWTAAFTSSSNVPEPATLALIALPLLLRRRS